MGLSTPRPCKRHNKSLLIFPVCYSGEIVNGGVDHLKIPLTNPLLKAGRTDAKKSHNLYLICAIYFFYSLILLMQLVILLMQLLVLPMQLLILFIRLLILLIMLFILLKQLIISAAMNISNTAISTTHMAINIPHTALNTSALNTTAVTTPNNIALNTAHNTPPNITALNTFPILQLLLSLLTLQHLILSQYYSFHYYS